MVETTALISEVRQFGIPLNQFPLTSERRLNEFPLASEQLFSGGIPLAGGDEFFSAGMPGETPPEIPYQETDFRGPGPANTMPIVGENGQVIGYRRKPLPGTIYPQGYISPASQENFRNAARQADIYSKIKTRLDDPSNDLLEELDRQWQVEYEAIRNNLVNQENELLARAKAEGWDERRTSFLRDSLYNQFAQDDMGLKGKYAEMQQQWGFIDKEIANRVKKGELNPQTGEAEQVARDLKMRMLGYSFPGRVRGELDRAAALAAVDVRIAKGEEPGRAAYLENVPEYVVRERVASRGAPPTQDTRKDIEQEIAKILDKHLIIDVQWPLPNKPLADTGESRDKLRAAFIEYADYIGLDDMDAAKKDFYVRAWNRIAKKKGWKGPDIRIR